MDRLDQTKIKLFRRHRGFAVVSRMIQTNSCLCD
ncbi:hypothetical protein GYH30_017450 [Glycine max]|nr:hypothetical protein GYH30_017450 [Glycine max]